MAASKLNSLSRNEWLIIGLLYFIATAININKAYHIDDTFHLEAANWIKDNPLRPMSGLINWDDNKEPMYVANQPPLYFYLIAFVSKLFGNSEIILHLFQSIFTLFSLVAFYKITKLLNLGKGLLLTTFFAFCPAFLVNQNLMVDVPLLCFDLWFLYYLLQQDVLSEPIRYWKASLILGLSLLIKYTNIPLFVVLLITILWRKQYRLLYVLLIPVFILGLWSLWNYVEFSAVHIVNRPRNPMTLDLFTKNLVDFITCVGAIAPFSLAFFVGYLSRYKIITFFIPLIALLFIGLTVATAKNRIFILTSNDILSTAFLINGLLIIVVVILSVWHNSFSSNKKIDIADVVLVMWIAAVSGFVILFAPFIASRHVLLIIPPVLFLGGRWLDNISILNASQAILVAASIGLIIAISDWQFADFYRRKAKEVTGVLPRQSRIWTVGHWGWQWYAQQNGFREVQTDSMQFHTGDYLVRPSGVDSQEIPNGVQLRPVSALTSPFTWLTFVSTGYYNCFYGRGTSWAYSKFPIDSIKIYQVTSVPIKQGHIGE
ncbi:ArnT family glycosyltransferase [Spirosoma endophyticum]|uniref:Dolichyl-phosphate-mannose-protein mannosyltransferase n=1 Tax=Spirosoma endophyticum TaxID=662367 RepID=A0A1I1LXA7_9BACT|nr:glycosyltransferase family 39 protein [Spirosoma endophyticum]SFC77749.1 Dolichyl-phosphate-mannose-protein mannosyltransferase [Spirosoma endophyticum]